MKKSCVTPSSLFIAMSLHGLAVISLMGFSSNRQQPIGEVFEVAFESLPTASLSATEELLKPVAQTDTAVVVPPESVSDETIKPIVQKIVRKQTLQTGKSAPAHIAVNDSNASDTATAPIAHAGRSTTSPSATEILNLSSWINRHKFYPTDARRKGEEGTVLLRISLLDNGNLKSYQVVRSSGSQALDRAASEILKRSSPYPQELAMRITEAEIPLVFSLEL